MRSNQVDWKIVSGVVEDRQIPQRAVLPTHSVCMDFLVLPVEHKQHRAIFHAASIVPGATVRGLTRKILSIGLHLCGGHDAS